MEDIDLSLSIAALQNQKPVFAHLHVHSEYSLTDGTIRVKDLISRVKELGHTHVALTDHSNMHAAIDFYLSAKEKELTPIIGCEIYHAGQTLSKDAFVEKDKNSRATPSVAPSAYQLVLLSKNNEGYKNLLKIVSEAYLGDQLGVIALCPESILDERPQGLVALSTCISGEVSRLVALWRKKCGKSAFDFDPKHPISGDIYQALASHIQIMQRRFGTENFYIELTRNRLPQQEQLIPDLISVARHFHVPLVASANAHYLNKEFSDSHALAIAIKNSMTLADIRSRNKESFFHLTDDKEMKALFADCPEALENSLKIAEDCSHLKIEMGKYFLPKIRLKDDESPEEALRRLAIEGLDERFTALAPIYGASFDEVKKQEYRDRLLYELDVIIKMGFTDYFLIVQDFIGWAKRQLIPVGPGRGSGAGSLVAYSLKITDIDPIPYTLIFERFLNPERVSMPDFDIDFCQWRRDEVIAYCIQKYGSKNVAQITTFGKMLAKGAFKSVGRAMNMSFTRMDQFTKLFPNDLGMTLAEAIKQEPRLNEEMSKDDMLKDCMVQALKLEGLTSHSSVHAAGVVISDGDMTNYVPIYTTDGKSYITQYEMKPTEKVGLVKFDFLGLKTLTVIDKAVQLLKQRLGIEFAIDKIPLADKKVYDMLSAGHTCGIFQCESSGMTQLILKLKPSCFEDIIALVALFRPGPLGSGMVDSFVERKHGREAITYLHPLLEGILKDTYGMIVYQEQVQKIAAVLANYTLGEADLLRRAMGKKIPAEMAKQKERFISGALQNQIKQEIADEVFDLMSEFANYGFNKSHSAAYGLVSYQTAYLKTYFPEEFLAASMTCDIQNTDKIIRYAQDCQRLGFKIRPPHIQFSTLEFWVPKAKEISFPLTAIKGVGEGSLLLLLKDRQERGAFQDLLDLARRLNLAQVGKKTIELLISVGALDGFGFTRSKLIESISELVSYSQHLHEAQSQGQRSLFDGDGASDDQQDNATPNFMLLRSADANSPQWEMKDLFIEKKLTGVFLSAHPLDMYQHDIKVFSSHLIKDFAKVLKSAPKNTENQNPYNKTAARLKISTVALISEVSMRRTKSGSLMAYVHLDQKQASIEAVMFSDAIAGKPLPSEGSLVLAMGNLELGLDGQIRLNLERVVPLAEFREERVGGVSFILNSSLSSEEIKSLHQRLTQEEGRTAVRFIVKHQQAQLLIKTPDLKVALHDGMLNYLYKYRSHLDLVYHFRE